MSKYAKINSENIVENIILAEDSVISSLDGFYVKVTDSSRNAEIGYMYNQEARKFIQKSIYPSWTLNEETLVYEAPVQKPLTGEYYWNEEGQEWIEIISGIEE
jgi:hypothetical protein